MLLIALIATSRTTAARLKSLLEYESYRVRVHLETERGVAFASSSTSDLIVLESASPNVDACSVLTAIRETNEATPVLVLGIPGDQEERLRFLRAGADDYLAGPVPVEELLVRIAVVLRRSWRRSPALAAKHGILHVTRRVAIDLRQRSVTRDGVDVRLTPRQYELFMALAAHGGEVVTRDQLTQEVWGSAGRVSLRVLNWHVQALRRRLEDDAAHPQLILTARSTGYRLASGIATTRPAEQPRGRGR